MKKTGVKCLFICCVLLLSVSFLGGPGPVMAEDEDIKTMLTEANKELRQAERDMFSGKTDKAIASLDKIKELIFKLKASDPGNTGIKTVENKYAKLVKDLERRTGRDLGGGTLTAAGSSLEPPPPEKTSPGAPTDKKEVAEPDRTAPPAGGGKPPAKVPFDARKPLASAVRLLDSLERNLDDLADPEYPGDKNQLVERIEGKLVEIRGSLDEARTAAARKGVTSHPDFIEAESKLAAGEKKVAQAKGEYKESQAEAAAKCEEVNADVKALKTEYDRVSPFFRGATGVVIYYNDLKPVEELIIRIEDFEKNELAKVTREMEAFAGKYGSTREEINKKAESMGYSGQFKASFPYTELAGGIENIKKTRIVMAEDLVKKFKERLPRIKTGHDFFVVEQYGDIKKWLQMAGRYDPENSEVKAAQANIDREIAQGLKDFHARIDRREWSSHASNAPQNAGKLARAAMEWFDQNPDWGRREKDPRRPLAVAVTGPWSIQEKNIIGEPIMYGLPVLLAVQVDSDRELNVARVYVLTLRTVEKRGVKMEPPFDHATVGDSYFIRPSNIN